MCVRGVVQNGVDKEAEEIQRVRGEEWPVAHVVRLPQLSLDEQFSGGGGLLTVDNMPQVILPNSCAIDSFI